MTKTIGQLVLTGISGLALNDQEKDFLKNENIGGVILFDRNYESPAQLAELISSIQTLRDEYPLFISVDHEGGRVQRFKKQFTHFPSMFDIGRLDSPKTIFEVYEIMALELAAVGINLSYAPVCDIWTEPANKVIGDRAFGTTEESVSKLITGAIRGLQVNKVIACAKHFPGHGATTKDSHFDLPIVKTSLDVLQTREFLPFSKAIKSRVEMVMMAHLVVDAIDPEKPTTLSSKAYKILRDELKFQKVIITDDMQMKAISDHFGVELAAVSALSSGADLILYRDMENAAKALAAIHDAVKHKKLKTEEINQKVERVTALKKEYLSGYNPVYIPQIKEKFGTGKVRDFLASLNEKITKLKE